MKSSFRLLTEIPDRSKANELMCQSFGHMYGLKFNVASYFNIYGPRMDAFGKYTEVVVRWYHLIKEGKPPLIFGDGKQIIDFIYVEDVARARIAIMKSEHHHGEVFNVATGSQTTLEELCFELLDVMRSEL